MKTDWTSLLNIGTAIGTVVAASAAVLTLWWQGRWHQKSTELELNWRAEEQFFRSEHLLKKRKAAGLALLENRIVPEVDTILDFFETIGDFVERKIMNKHLICSVFYNRAIAYWYSCENHVKAERIRLKSDELWTGFEELVKTLNQVKVKKLKKTKRMTSKQARQALSEIISLESIRERLLDESKAL